MRGVFFWGLGILALIWICLAIWNLIYKIKISNRTKANEDYQRYFKQDHKKWWER